MRIALSLYRQTLRDLLDFCIERGILRTGDKGRLDDGAGRRA